MKLDEIEFSCEKWHGCGNDFVLIDNMDGKIPEEKWPDFAKKLCDRHFGIGADGILLLIKSRNADADFTMKIFNSDGSEAEMCGNGIRCCIRYAYEHNLIRGDEARVETGRGLLRSKIILDENKKVSRIQVNMGTPILSPAQIPVAFPNDLPKIISQPIEIFNQKKSMNEKYLFTAVSMGNPHAVIFIDDEKLLTDEFLETVGRAIETHKYFPKKTNVEFLCVRDKNNVRMRVWERGCGITLACGTGACASLTSCILNQKTNHEVNVHLDGGTLLMQWNEDTQEIFMTGPAEKVFSVK